MRIQTEKTYSLSKAIVNEFCPGEIPYFDIIWNALVPYFKDGSITSYTAQESVLGGLGISDIKDMLSPVVIGALLASISHIQQSDIENEDVPTVIDSYIKRFRVNAKHGTRIKQAIFTLIDADDGKKEDSRVGSYYAIINGKVIPNLDETDIDDYESKKNQYDIFINDIKGRVFVNKTKIDVSKQTNHYKTLILFCENVGCLIDKERVFKEGIYKRDETADDWTKDLAKGRLVQRIIEIKDKLRPHLGAEADLWIDTTPKNMVKVGDNLKVCVIQEYQQM